MMKTGNYIYLLLILGLAACASSPDFDDARMFAEQFKYAGPCEECIDILELWQAKGYE